MEAGEEAAADGRKSGQHVLFCVQETEFKQALGVSRQCAMRYTRHIVSISISGGGGGGGGGGGDQDAGRHSHKFAGSWIFGTPPTRD